MDPKQVPLAGPLRPEAMLKTRTIKSSYEPRAKASGMTWEQSQAMLASRTHPRRLMTLEQCRAAFYMQNSRRLSPRGKVTPSRSAVALAVLHSAGYCPCARLIGSNPRGQHTTLVTLWLSPPANLRLTFVVPEEH
jgi:hypothetical protein